MTILKTLHAETCVLWSHVHIPMGRVSRCLRCLHQEWLGEDFLLVGRPDRRAVEEGFAHLGLVVSWADDRVFLDGWTAARRPAGIHDQAWHQLRDLTRFVEVGAVISCRSPQGTLFRRLRFTTGGWADEFGDLEACDRVPF